MIVLIFLLVLSGCTSQTITDASQDKAITSQLQNMLKSQWTKYVEANPNVPGGIAIKVLNKDRSYFASYGMESDTTENVHFRTASITKTFTAAAILLLQQKGLLNIEDTVISTIPGSQEAYLPDTSDYAIPYKDSITIKQLLEHRAGVFDINNSIIPPESQAPYAGQNYVGYVLAQDPQHTFTIDEVVGVIASENLSYTPPGTDYHYSDTGFSILGKIIERVSGQSYGDFVTQNFLQPNGLNDSSLPYLGTDQIMPELFAMGYDYYNGDSEKVAQDNISLQLANGNLITTPKNLAEWGKKLYTGQAGLNEESVKLMMDVIPVNDTAGYGLGCQYVNNLGYGHSGAIKGYLSTMIYDPENDLTIVIFTSVLNWSDTVNQQLFLRDIAFNTREILGYPGKPIS